MTKISKTYKEVFNFLSVAANYLVVHRQDNKDTKVLRIIGDLVGDRSNGLEGKLKPVLKSYQKKIDDIELDFCSVDERGNIIMSEDGKKLSYTVPNFKALKLKKEELEDEVVEIDVYYMETLDVKEFNEMELKAFSGFLFDSNLIKNK